MSRLWAVIRLIHPFPAATVVLTSGVLIVVAHHGFPGGLFLIRALAVVAATQVPVGALNEYIDRDLDARSQPDKPIPSGCVSPRTALWMVAVGLIALIVLGASFGLLPLAVILLGTAGGLAYDLWLKPTAFSIAGYIVGFLSLLTWIWLIAGRFFPAFLLVYPAGVLALVAAHLAQSYPDIESDRSLGERGLAVRLGPVWTRRLIAVPYVALMLSGTGIALAAGSWLAGAAVAIASILGLLAWLLTRRHPESHRARQQLFHLAAPGIGLLAIGCLIALEALD